MFINGAISSVRTQRLARVWEQNIRCVVVGSKDSQQDALWNTYSSGFHAAILHSKILTLFLKFFLATCIGLKLLKIFSSKINVRSVSRDPFLAIFILLKAIFKISKHQSKLKIGLSLSVFLVFNRR